MCGQTPIAAEYLDVTKLNFPKSGLGLSQLNELLLALHLDRMDAGLFEFIFGSNEVKSEREFEEGIRKFRIKSIIKYGNFKYGFKYLKNKSYECIINEFSNIEPSDSDAFKNRHEPLVEIEKIQPEDTYFWATWSKQS